MFLLNDVPRTPQSHCWLEHQGLFSQLLSGVLEMLLFQAGDVFNLLTSVGQMFGLLRPNLV